MRKTVEKFVRDEAGATAIEYGLLAALIGVAIIGGASSFGSGTVDMYTYLTEKVSNGLARLD